MINKRFLYRCLIIALIFGMALTCFGQRVNTQVPWPYYPNRPGVQAYMQGGAYAATSGSVTSMLFNPAGLAEVQGRLMMNVEGGWSSEGEYAPAYDLDASSQFIPLQFAGVTWKAKSKLSIGVFYSRPTHYRLELEPIPITTVDHPDGTGEFMEWSMEREQTSLGLVLATALSEQLVVGGGLEWRRAIVRDQLSSTIFEGKADDFRYSFGMILKVHDWNIGVAAQSRYKSSGHAKLKSSPRLGVVDDVDPPPGTGGNNQLPSLETDTFPFSSIEPSTFRFGIMTPYALDRLRFSFDLEYKDFEDADLIEPWQYYGGVSLKLTPHAHVSFGAFTFSNNYRKFIDGPASETFLTVGGEIELSRLRFSVNFIDGDLLADEFTGQQFVNFAGYVLH